MDDRGKLHFIAVGTLLLAISVFLHGCAASVSSERKLPVMKGTFEVIPGSVVLKTLTIPTTEELQRGSVFLFTPVEFPGSQARFRWEGIKQPIGQSSAVRTVGEGLLSGVPVGHAKTFMVRYKVAFDSLSEARAHFSRLRDDQVLHTPDGSQRVEVINWTFRLVLLPAQDGKAFRVMTDSLRYYNPMLGPGGADEASDNEASAKPVRIPVLIGFFYRHPQYETQASHQHNVIFDYAITFSDSGESVGRTQFSNWLPLQPNSQTAPYSIEIAVAEITSEPEQFLPVLRGLIKDVKDIF